MLYVTLRGPAQPGSRGAKMAARWGAGEETLTIGGMELFTAGGPLQCHGLEEQGGCDGLSDLALSSLDAGILGTFQGYIDHSIISIIDDNGTQAGNKGHFDEENELSLLTALTEILDNADDENMSPFDSIPDSELLVSPKDRDGNALQKFLSLTRTPPEREISLDDQRRLNFAKIDVRSSGPNWDLFPDALSSTPKRRTRQKSIRACLPRRAITELTLQRSDGEEEDYHLSEKGLKDIKVLLSDKDASMEPEEEMEELGSDLLMQQDTPCIINTENVALTDLVKYMHPYCLPSLAVCLDPEDEEELIDDEGIFLEVVSEHGETIKVPVIVEQAESLLTYQSSEEDMPILDAVEDFDIKSQTFAEPESTSEQSVPELDLVKVETLQSSEPEEGSTPMESMPVLEKMSPEPVINGGASDENLVNVQMEINTLNNKESESKVKLNDEMEKDKAPTKGRKMKRKHRNDKAKAKTKEQKPQAFQEMSAPSRTCNPSLQESDLLIKTLDQVKKDSEMELRSAKVTRSKARPRLSMENQEKKGNENVKKEETNEHPKSDEYVEVDVCSEKMDLSPQPVSVQEPVLNEGSADDYVAPAVSDSTSNPEVTQTSEPKEPKPKSLSLSEYRKRLQSRKPNQEKEAENSSCSKWPSIPEPPAELPCLIPMPSKAKNATVEIKQSQSKSDLSIKPNPTPTIPAANSNPTPTIPAANSNPTPTIPAANSNPTPTIPVANTNPTPTIPAANSNPIPTIPAANSNPITTIPAASSNPIPTNFQLAPTSYASSMTFLDSLPQKPSEEVCPTFMDTTPPPILPMQQNGPPPFFPPAWPNIPSHPQYYPGLPPPPQFPNAMPPMLPIQPPPPVMNWPPFPPPSIAMPPVHPSGWVPGMPPPPFWSNPQVPQALPDPPIPFMATNQPVMPEQRMLPETLAPPVAPHNQMQQSPVKKPERKDRSNASVKKCSPSKSGIQASSEAKKSDRTSTFESKTVPDVNAANQVVLKIMEILKKAQKCGFQINLPSIPVAQKPESSSGVYKTLEVSGVKVAETKKLSIPTQELRTTAAAKVSTTPTEQTMADPSRAVKDDVVLPPTVNKQARAASQKHEQHCTKEENLHASLPSANQKQPEEGFDTGIEASDLSSLLEEFEKSEAKDEERLPHSPDKLAVGSSGSEKAAEKNPLEKHLAPELANTAGLTPPATPPHQLWKTVSGNLNVKTKPVLGATLEKPCSSPLKSTVLIDPKPLPQSKLKSRNLGAAPAEVVLPPVHVASGDHDYCILSAGCQEKEAVVAEKETEGPCAMEEGSRWNVKHHKNIVIKPIMQFNKRPQNKACPKTTTANASPAATNCESGAPETPCKSSQKDKNQPLDHRTNDNTELALMCPPASVLMSPDASPCRSDHGESRTAATAGKGNASGTRRSQRCYRKYRNSASPPSSPWRGRSSDSSSSSSSSSCSSSRSRSRSPPSKRRRKSSYRSRHRSRSSSRSSYSSRSSSRYSSPSSRSCSPSSSRSRSRSRSPCRRRYRSRSRRCESRESYYRQKMYHKERAIEERRVVYIGKINSQMTRSELRRRFSIFGDIEECSIHFREHGDNYGFVTYHSTGQAFAAIENGHKLRLPDELPFDLCFGGRRQFCKSNYADLDSNRDDFDPAPVRSKFESLDFDTLLKQAQKSHRR